MKALLTAVILGLVCTPTAASSPRWQPDSEASRVANVFAMRTDVEVRCFTEYETMSPYPLGAWGYTMPLITPIMFLDGPTVCAGIDAIRADDPRVPDWEKALGALVLTHEAYHLRPWAFRFDEGRVECQAIRHWRYAARMLGATTVVADRLWPWALAFHWRITRLAPPYNYTGCIVPNPF